MTSIYPVTFRIAIVLFASALFSMNVNSAWAWTNTQSIDLESSSGQYLYVSDGSQTGLDLSGDFTIESWVKLESVLAHSSLISKWEGVSGGRSYNVVIRPNDVLLNVRNSGDTTSGSASIDYDFVSGVWTHVAVTFDVSAGQMELFINGESQGTAQGTLPTSILAGTSGVAIGAQETQTDPQGYIDGLVDEVQVWSEIRSSGEIEDDMNMSLVGNETNLIAYWNLNATTTDKTANNNDLTLQNAPSFSEIAANLIKCEVSSSTVWGSSLLIPAVCSVVGLF